MKVLKGKPIAPGYAAGNAVVLQPSFEAVPRRSIADSEVAGEIARLDQALTRSIEELDKIQHRVHQELGKSHSGIFVAHMAILNDPHFIKGVMQRIEKERVNVEQALDAEIASVCDQIARADNPYLRERQQDVRDVGRRLLGHLTGLPVTTASSLPPKAVLVARELLPSDTLNIDRDHLVAIATEEGGETSHAAILARALGVPAVTAVPHLMRHVHSGMTLLINAEEGEVVISPESTQITAFSERMQRWEDDTRESVAAESLNCTTLDGVTISLLGNVARPEESLQVMKHRLDGIGLLRTEFLFLDSSAPPSVEFQTQVYRQIVDAVPGKTIVVRTLDMAGDKHPRYLAAEFDHQLLAYRGLRFSLKERDLFQAQVTAIARLPAERDVRILLPMVIDPQDLVRAIEIINDCSAKEVRHKRPSVGIMIETPAAVVLLDRLLEHVDFLSIGTNDLTQYLLAADRSAIDFDDDYSVLHPAVLRTIHQVVTQSVAAKKPLSVCGEAAGDPKVACLLAGLGIRQLSMSPVRSARVRQALRNKSLKQLEQLAADVIRCGTTSETRLLMERLFDVPNCLP